MRIFWDIPRGGSYACKNKVYARALGSLRRIEARAVTSYGVLHEGLRLFLCK